MRSAILLAAIIITKQNLSGGIGFIIWCLAIAIIMDIAELAHYLKS